MKNENNYSTLVIAGLWNNAIFNPEWVSRFLLPNTNLNVEIPLNVNGSTKLSTEELSIFALDGKLNFVILKHDDEVLLKIGELANQIADYLPHTPVTAFGLNYLFDNEINTALDECLKLSDLDKLNEYGWSIQSTSIIRKLKKENYILTLAINRLEERYQFNLNYNFQIKSLTEFKEIFESQSLVQFKKEALEILTNLFKLELQ